MSTKVFTEDHDWVSSDGKVQSHTIPSLCAVLLWRTQIVLSILVLQPLFGSYSAPSHLHSHPLLLPGRHRGHHQVEFSRRVVLLRRVEIVTLCAGLQPRPSAKSFIASCQRWVYSHTPHLTPHTSHLTPRTSHLTPHTPQLTPHTSHLIRHTSHLTPHTSHLTPHTSHLTPRTSHLTPHTSHPTPHTSRCRWEPLLPRTTTAPLVKTPLPLPLPSTMMMMPCPFSRHVF